jgi:L-glutamine:2-deoxy-scyllo-inosose/3-amino-2,3-dideoxy-scyllo-inosose aminotransferase
MRSTDKTDVPVVLGGLRRSDIAAHSWPVSGEEELAYLRRVLDSGHWASDGPLEGEFERRFAEIQNAHYGLCVANGTVALQLALEALDVGVGDEVIVPGFTWQATAAAVLDVNATPILVDAHPDTYCPDPELIDAAITPRTKGVIVVHLYNCLSDMDRIVAIANRNNLFVIEDCAHSHGSQWKGRGVGSIGDAGTFSFQSSKTLTAGEGGFVTTNDEELFERLYSLRNCGRPRESARAEKWHPIQSGNYRITEWQAAILLAQLERFPHQMMMRERNAELLDEALGCIPGIRPTERHPNVTRRNSYAYVFRYDARRFAGLSCRAFRIALSKETGLDFGPPYRPLNMSLLYQPRTKRRHRLNDHYWDQIDPSRYSLPVAERAYEHEAVTLPQEALLVNPDRVRLVPEAVRRLQRHAADLVEWELSEPPQLAEAPLPE